MMGDMQIRIAIPGEPIPGPNHTMLTMEQGKAVIDHQNHVAWITQQQYDLLKELLASDLNGGAA